MKYKQKKIGTTFKEFEDLLENGCADNANINYNPEMIVKYGYDSIAKEYALLTMPSDVAQAHKEGYIHIHDLEFYSTRANCCNYDLRFFARNGLKIDGTGDCGAVAQPAKSLEVLLNHMLQAWMAGATTFSGGQGYVNFNTLLAPFAKGRTYEDIKQAIQGFIFNCNMSLVCRGGQILFSSISLDLSCPEPLANEPAIGPGGIAMGVYKDYLAEADLIFRAVCEVLDEKDGEGNYFRFPNTIFNIREGDLDEYEGNCKILHELSAKNPTIYFNNCVQGERTVMGCRTSLPMNYAENYKDDCMNTGNFAYTSINLPLIAEDCEQRSEYLARLDEICEIAYKGLIHRRETVHDVIYNKRMSTFLLWEDKDTGEPLYDLDRTTITLGFVGLYEALAILDRKFGETDVDFGELIIKMLNVKKEEFNIRDNLRWSVIGSPAESTAGRFAKINLEKYPDTIVQAPGDAPFLTNSSHIPVNSGEHLPAHIRNADKYHKHTLGGNILHLFMGEAYPQPAALWKFNQKISKTNTLFWAFTSEFTFCKDCGFTINEEVEECPKCKSTNIRVYSRITGYYLPKCTWNESKLSEASERTKHSNSEINGGKI